MIVPPPSIHQQNLSGNSSKTRTGLDGSLVGRSVSVIPNANANSGSVVMVAHLPLPVGLTPKFDEIYNEQTPLTMKQNAELKGIWSFLRIIVLVVLCIGSLALMVTLAIQKTADGRSFPSYPMHSDTDDAPAAQLKKPGDCLGPPYIYVTLHDKIQNVLKYSRDGCLMDDAVLLMSEAYTKSSVVDVSFRSLSVGKHKDHDMLFIADASKHDSRLLIFSQCIDPKEDFLNRNKRHFVEVVAEYSQNPGLDHSYGVCHDSNGNVYVSNQHTDCVLRFEVDTWKPMPLAPALQLGERLRYYDGTFVQFGEPSSNEKKGKDGGKEGVRALAHVGSEIWIAHESLSGIVVADVTTGQIMHVIPVETPVGLFHMKEKNTTFVGCKGDKDSNRGGIVYAINVNTRKVETGYEHHDMVHPTGVVAYEGVLYVADQSLGSILAFDIATTAFLGKVVKENDYVDQMEGLALTMC